MDCAEQHHVVEEHELGMPNVAQNRTTTPACNLDNFVYLDNLAAFENDLELVDAPWPPTRSVGALEGSGGRHPLRADST